MKFLYLQLILCWSLLHVSVSQDVLLDSTLNGPRVAYEGQRIIFTCVARNSLILQWRSDQYIGIGDSQLQLFSSGSEDRVSSIIDPNTFARRIGNTSDNGVPVIESELHLIASLQHQTATITCDNNGHGESKSITFQTIAMPPDNVTLTVSLNSTVVAYDGQMVVFTCVTRNALILQWRNNEYIGTGDSILQLFSSGSSDIASSTINPHTYAKRLNTTSGNQPPVIVSQLHLIASVQHPTATVTCANNGLGQSRSIMFQTISSKPEATEVETTTWSVESSQGVDVTEADSVPVYVYAISIPVSVGVVVVVVVVIIIIITIILFRRAFKPSTFEFCNNGVNKLTLCD